MTDEICNYLKESNTGRLNSILNKKQYIENTIQFQLIFNILKKYEVLEPEFEEFLNKIKK